MSTVVIMKIEKVVGGFVPPSKDVQLKNNTGVPLATCNRFERQHPSCPMSP